MQILNTADAFIMIIEVGIVVFIKRSVLNREMEYFQIVFVFADGHDHFLGPDINDSIANHPRVAT